MDAATAFSIRFGIENYNRALFVTSPLAWRLLIRRSVESINQIGRNEDSVVTLLRYHCTEIIISILYTVQYCSSVLLKRGLLIVSSIDTIAIDRDISSCSLKRCHGIRNDS